MFSILVSEKNYRRLFFAGIINGVGDRFSQVALLTLVLQLTGSAMSVGITLAVRMIPFLLFGPFSSKAAIIFSRKKVLIFTDVIRSLIAFSFLFIETPGDIWIVYCGSFLLSAGEAFYAPARKAAIPAVASQEKLKEVNSWEMVSTGFILVVGALSGGIVSFLFGAKSAFIVNIVSFLAAAAIISRIPSLEQANDSMEGSGTGKPAIGFLSILPASALLILLAAGDIIFPLINGIENVLLSVYAVETYHAADLGVGILYSVLGTGLIISPVITKHIKSAYLPISFFCLIMEGVILSLISQAPSFGLVVLLFGILTIFGGVGNTLLDTAIMETLPSRLHGPYFSFSATVGNTMIGLSMFLSGVTLNFLSPRELGLIGGLLYIGSGIVFLLWSRVLDIPREKQVLLGKAS